MAGIYFHIPFCKTKCIYCDFYSETGHDLLSDYKTALCEELKNRRDYLQHESVETIYFGGGTPSLLSAEFFHLVLDVIHNHYSVSSQPEVTIEANPDDLTTEYIAKLRLLPINRLSIGIQSFVDDELSFLNRRHTTSQAENVIKECQHIGFDNISIDLMYGLPIQTIKSWQYTLEKAIQLQIQHISAYHLIYEIGTPLYKYLINKTITPVNDELSTTMFEKLIDMLVSSGFSHYEISNFAKTGYISKHNSSYWNRTKYLGVGAAAHSYNLLERSYNVADIRQYIQGIYSGKSIAHSETINQYMGYNEFVITSLRTKWGISLIKLEALFGNECKEYFLKQAKKYLSGGLLNFINHDVLRLSRKGIFVSDGIMADLLFVEDEIQK